MGVKPNDNDNPDNNYVFTRKAGRSIIERRPVFAPDGESVLLIVENLVRVYNIQTGDCSRTLETETPVRELVAVQFPENEEYNLYGCSNSGCVTIWTWENGAVLREINLQLPEEMKIMTFDLLDSNECFITAFRPYNRNLYLATYSVKTGNLIHEYIDTSPFYYNIVRVAVGWCYGDRFAAIVNGTARVYIQNLYQPHVRTEIVNHNKFRILSVAAHYNDNAIAVTDAFGRVTIFRGNLYDYRNVAREVLHWHFLPPLAVCFSVQGNYVMSGGMEKVLVKWTLGHLANKANEKIFIPRLPGMIRFITANSSHVAITLTNNSVVIASAQLRVLSTLLECGGLSPVARAINTALVYHRPLDALLMSGRTGHLQLYSTASDKVLYNIDITEINSTPSERKNLLPLETEITCVTVSGNGTWLVTSEYRNDGITYPEEKLKFWLAQKKNPSPFKLNTCVNLSHGGCNVVSLALNFRGHFCVSAGTDQKIRIWKRESTILPHKKIITWSCVTACYYSSGTAQFLSHNILNNFKIGEKVDKGRVETMPYLTEVGRDDDIIGRILNIHREHSFFNRRMINDSVERHDEFSMGGVAISQDGSLIAAWFGCKLTLWDSHLCSLRSTLTHPALRPKGMQVQFGSNDAAHYLVCTTERCLAVWSLLSLTVKWYVQLHPTCLAADPASNKMAITTVNNDVYIFTPHSSTPLMVHKGLLDPRSGVFRQCTFAAAAKDHVRLYVMRNNSEIYCLEPAQSDEGRLEAISRRNMPASKFGALLAEHRVSEVLGARPAQLQPDDLLSLGRNVISQFLSAAPHMMPPMSLLCTPILEHISGQKVSEAAEEEEEIEEMDVDPQSSDDEEVDKKLDIPPSPKIAELWTPNYEEVKEKRLKKILNEPFLDLHDSQTIFE
ncbi:PREDICTED: WD repeat-containing protein 75 [Papilio xuthus]|uniref:WD repeat-containing protein 75 n=1 Tax=Papilio xuthus TaxID=66420 RepID=A0AAJ7E6L6_PAPXU|nr:PREDICTED: WD repeat-containing protein 75 [Papilio xuthus]